MQYVMCDVWCMMCDVADLIFCKILTLWVKGRPKIPHLGNFRPFELYSKIDPRWQSYVHYNLQGLLGRSGKHGEVIKLVPFFWPFPLLYISSHMWTYRVKLSHTCQKCKRRYTYLYKKSTIKLYYCNILLFY